ncbi:sensor histidine kinase [Lysobacter antibioticus]|uniref:sensor histidine kinase n=1 Tax=Lysobacter antibioticus TaxID=84531 RepID=UPI00068A9B0A|nr:HAMP domain-containing sensor histidine kinase [Lysobacter antibioticus]
MPQRSREQVLRSLHLRLTASWTLAWLLCVATLCIVAISVHARLSQLDFESRMQLRATAIYGLTWFDERGAFHDEVLRKEPGVLDAGSDVWVIAPGPPDRILLQPGQPRFDPASPTALAASVLRRGDFAEDGRDRRGRSYRLQAKLTYDHADRPIAAILVLADPGARDAAQAAFVRWTLLAVAVLAAVGVLVGNALARRSLRPVVQSFEMQERFIAAAAHELRTPVAGLLALCESADAGEAPPTQTLGRVNRIAAQTAGLVDKLLLLARLDSANAQLANEQVRLDLLVEAVLPEDGSVSLDACESVIRADPRLVQIAVRNLVENALAHAAADGTREPIAVTVRDRTVVVEDRGSGFPAELMQRLTEPFVARAASPGSGLGLSIVQHIAQLHGGRLRLENRAGGGARAILQL